MFTVINNILSLLTGKERRQLFWLSIAIVLMALVEVAGIASVMPFMAVVGNPEVVQTNQWINWVYRTGGFTSPDRFLVFLGFIVLFIIIASNVFKATTTWLELRFVNFRTYSLSRRLFYHYLTQPYTFFLNQNTQLLGKNLLQEVFQFMHSVLKPATEIFSKVIVTLCIFGLLLCVDPLLAVIIVTILGGAYAFLYCVVQRKLARLGEERFEANAQRFKTTGEALTGIKDLKILGREPVFFAKFSVHARQMAGNMTSHQTISQLPRFVMEAVSFGGILLIVLYFLMIKADVGQTLPILALYAFAGYRLMPALQNIFSAATTIRFNLAAVDALRQNLAGMADLPSNWSRSSLPALPFRDKIQFERITFAYPGAANHVIRGLNLIIVKNSSVGFVGATGSGKTTIVDILLGLLEPQEGFLKIDGTPITPENLPRWQRNLGYVPQTIFLCDDSITGNIAFGEPPEEIDMAAVERAAKIANLHDFVMNDLPEGYATHVGERGVRLSGGQRQRIGIARALYHNPEILIMDEATSALDGITEEAVIQAISNLAGEKTIITIAHRLTTLRDCDVIYVMEKGQVIEEGTYAQLSRSSTRFQAMARTGSGRDQDFLPVVEN
jgi:ABC-type multidrug transport system fused ATPase/permease subunit